MKKTACIMFSVVFFLLCLIPGVGMLIRGPAPAAANELPAPKPVLIRADGSLNTGYLSQLQNYVANGFFLRLEGVTAWDTLASKVFRTSANEDVLIGPDGWLFYGGAVSDISGADQMSDRQIWCAARSLALMQEYAEGQGAGFLFAPVCGKYTLYPEHAPAYITVAEGSDRERLQDALAEQGVNYVNLYDPFVQAGEELYYQWDSHWNSRGAALAADAILAVAGRDTDYFAGPFTAVRDHTGDLYEMLYPTGKALEDDYAWDPGFTFSYRSDFHSADDITIETENAGAAGSLVMFRDSSGRSLYPYMAQSFGRGYFSRQNAYRLDQAAEQEADLVVVEIAERTLDYLLQYPAVYPAPAREASVLDGARAVESALEADDADAVLEGYRQLRGTLPETAVDAAVYVAVDGAVYEAIPNEGGFTAYIPLQADWENAQIYVGM